MRSLLRRVTSGCRQALSQREVCLKSPPRASGPAAKPVADPRNTQFSRHKMQSEMPWSRIPSDQRSILKCEDPTPSWSHPHLTRDTQCSIAATDPKSTPTKAGTRSERHISQLGELFGHGRESASHRAIVFRFSVARAIAVLTLDAPTCPPTLRATSTIRKRTEARRQIRLHGSHPATPRHFPSPLARS